MTAEWAGHEECETCPHGTRKTKCALACVEKGVRRPWSAYPLRSPLRATGHHSQCSGLQAEDEAKVVAATRSVAVSFRRAGPCFVTVMGRSHVPGDDIGSTCLV